MFNFSGAYQVALIVIVLAVLSGCAETQLVAHSAKVIVGAVNEKTTPEFKVGAPYQIAGIWYYPQEDYDYDQTGIASWYGAKFHGLKTANGGIYDMNALTAAHRTLQMPSFVRVTNLDNGRSLVLKINDRGPFARGRIIDISRRGAQLLGFQKQGTARVRVQILADRSRALAARIKGQAQLAKVGSPITVKRLPKTKVKTEALALLTGAMASPVQRQPVANARVAPTRQPQAAPIDSDGGDGKIKIVPTSKTNIFVQAGAFSHFDNANRVRARLSTVGSVKISPVLINGRDLYRVRVGPFTNVSAADKMLETITYAGYPKAQIIIE